MKISGPLLDRIEIQLEVPEVKFKDIVSRVESESSQIIKERVCREEAGGAEGRVRNAGDLLGVINVS